MVLYWICVIALFGVGVYGDDTCPTPEEIAPCKCDDEGVNCMGARTLDEIKKVFQAKFKYGGVRSVWIQDTPITNLPAGIFGSIRCQQFALDKNQITTVDLKAFSVSNKTLQALSLFGNKIKDFDFGGISKFERLGSLNLGSNQIEVLPDNAFSSRSLYSLYLSQNKIRHIGSNAFKNLPNLGILEMVSNQVLALGPRSLTIDSRQPRLQINLSANQISDVDEDSFTGLEPLAVFLSQNRLKSLEEDAFANLVTKVAQKRGIVDVSGNPFTCKGCDYSWLVTYKGILANKLVGFTCTDGRSLTDLTKSNIGCH